MGLVKSSSLIERKVSVSQLCIDIRCPEKVASVVFDFIPRILLICEKLIIFFKTKNKQKNLKIFLDTWLCYWYVKRWVEWSEANPTSKSLNSLTQNISLFASCNVLLILWHCETEKQFCWHWQPASKSVFRQTRLIHWHVFNFWMTYYETVSLFALDNMF